MNTAELLNTRLYNQLLSGHHLTEVQEVVSRMGAMQSQSLELAKWAIGARLQGKTVKDVEEALNTGKIIRTHTLRPTWHFVSADDFYWMFDLSNPRLKPIYRSYCKISGADESLIFRSIPIVEKLLSGGNHLSKQEISERLAAEKITLDATHLNLTISCAEMEGILCNGQLRGNKQTFTLLSEWLPRKQSLHKEEALERLARRYFTSHGPATVQDFAWWSGLSLTECKQALEMVQPDFVSETVNERVFWMKNDLPIPPAESSSALLLSPFDEFVVSYKDRSEIVHDKYYGKVMTKNGLFSPTIMLHGEIIGSWKKTTKNKTTEVALSFFEKTPLKVQKLFNPEIERIKNFYSQA